MNIIKNAAESLSDIIGRHKENKTPGAHILADFPNSIQPNSHSCSIQSAYSILKYFGKVRSIQSVKKILGDSTDGISEYPLIKLFRMKGLKVAIRNRAKFKDIVDAIDNKKGLMLIYLTKRGHWAVIYGYAPHHFFVMDPAPIYLSTKSLKINFHLNRWRKKELYNEWPARWGAIVYNKKYNHQ